MVARSSQQAATQSATLDFFREAVANLLDSFDARVRVDSAADSTAADSDGATAEQRDTAARLAERLGRTNRLAKGKFVGPDHFTSVMSQFAACANRLDAAFVPYRRSSKGSPDARVQGATAFQGEINKVRADLNLSATGGGDGAAGGGQA